MAGRFQKISKTDKLLMCWWVFTGLTHAILEGYFVFSPEFYKEKTPFYLAELCKFFFYFSFSYDPYNNSSQFEFRPLRPWWVMPVNNNWQGKNTAKVIQDMQQEMLVLLLLKELLRF